MSRPAPPRLPAPVAAALEAAGVDWELRHGTKHWKLFVGGRMAMVVSHGPAKPSAMRQTALNGVRDVRRVIRLIKETSDDR